MVLSLGSGRNLPKMVKVKLSRDLSASPGVSSNFLSTDVEAPTILRLVHCRIPAMTYHFREVKHSDLPYPKISVGLYPQTLVRSSLLDVKPESRCCFAVVTPPRTPRRWVAGVFHRFVVINSIPPSADTLPSCCRPCSAATKS